MHTDGSTMVGPYEFHAACAVLGLSTAPSASEAKAAFRVRAALVHPDVHQSAGTDRMHAATSAMQQLSDAYQLVLESLAAGDPIPTSITQGQNEMTRRCTNCRDGFRYTASGARVVCRRCGRGSGARLREARPHSHGGLRAGRTVVSSSRRRPQQRTEPLGRLSHLRPGLDGR